MDLKQAKKLIAQTQKYYEDQAQAFSSARQRPWPLLLSLLHYIRKGDRVLDIGSGNGRLYPLVSQKGATYLGLDLSPAMFKKARNLYPAAHFKEGDVLGLSGKPRFSLVFLIAVLHHIPGKSLRRRAVRNVFKVLKPGGCLIMSNWNLFQKRFWFARWKQNFKKLFGKSRLDWNDLIFRKRRYYHGFKKREIKKLLHKAGFEVLKNYYEREGRRAGKWRGRNLVTVAKKSE